MCQDVDMKGDITIGAGTRLMTSVRVDLLNGLKEMLSPFSLNHLGGLKTAASSPHTCGMRDST